MLSLVAVVILLQVILSIVYCHCQRKCLVFILVSTSFHPCFNEFSFMFQRVLQCSPGASYRRQGPDRRRCLRRIQSCTAGTDRCPRGPCNGKTEEKLFQRFLFCGRVLNTVRQFEEHLKTHSTENKCNQCNYAIPQKRPVSNPRGGRSPLPRKQTLHWNFQAGSPTEATTLSATILISITTILMDDIDRTSKSNNIVCNVDA